MARVSKDVKLYQDIQQNPELRKINAEVNEINRLIASMGRSQYFAGISLPEQLNKFDIVQSAKENLSLTSEYLNAIQGTLSNIWEQRRDSDVIQGATSLVASQNDTFYKTLKVLPSSALKRAERTSRGQLSEEAVSNIIEDDVIMLKRLTGKSDADIRDFLNLWYKSPEISGGMLLENFIDAVYQRDYAGVGASLSWGSPTVKDIISREIEPSMSEVESEPESDEITESYEVEQKMSDDLWESFINLFDISV